jgi:hypothetical protein
LNVIAPGAAGILLTKTALAGEVAEVPQELVAVTVMSPPVAVDEKFTVVLFVVPANVAPVPL